MKRRDLEKRLRSLGWTFVRRGGRHDIWGLGDYEIAIPRHNEINEHTTGAILRSAKGEKMRFAGRAFKSRRYWAAEVPILGIFTQGCSLHDAYAMVANAIEALVNRPGFAINIFKGKDGEFEIGASDEVALTALLLRRARIRSGLTLVEVAARLGEKSINGYARYEQGRAIPSIKKLSQLYAVVGRNGDFVVGESRIEAAGGQKREEKRPPRRRTTDETLAAVRSVREKTKGVWLDNESINEAKRAGRR
jgi:mRNA interferase HicA